MSIDRAICLISRRIRFAAILLPSCAAFLLCAQPSFSAEIPFTSEHSAASTITNAGDLHPTDVDRDGDIDLVGTASASDTVFWLENVDSAGTNWIEHVLDAAFSGASAAVTGDVDRDGKPDIVAAAVTGDEIAWWRNTDGSGTNWIKYVVDSAAGGPGSVSVGDVNGDGALDVVGAAIMSNEISWLQNVDGTGTNWTKHVVATNFMLPSSVSVADMDDDGDTDIVSSANGASTLGWFENMDGSGTNWTAHNISTSLFGAVAAVAIDIDRDGDRDIVGAGAAVNKVAWWENADGAATLWVEHAISVTFTQVTEIAVADLDADGDFDVVAAGTGMNAIVWWENTDGSGATWVEWTIRSGYGGALRVSVTDLDHDGDRDVVGSALSLNDVTWWENRTIHRSAMHGPKWSVSSNFNGAFAVAPIDLDRDGDVDLCGGAYTADTVSWFENLDSMGSTWTQHVVASFFDGVYWVRSADMDRDGDADLVGAAGWANDIAWWENLDGSGNSWTQRMVDPLFLGASCVDASDVDGDGSMDLIGSASTWHRLAWWRNNDGFGTAWTQYVITTNLQSALFVRGADIDLDGDADVLAAAGAANKVAWFENTDGTGTNWLEHVVTASLSFARAAAVADIDRDGDMDVVAVGQWTDDVVWFENTDRIGTVWTMHDIDMSFHDAYSIESVDMDCDGDCDVLAAGKEGHQVAWWENQGGSGTNWIKHAVGSSLPYSQHAVSVDLDRDGDFDVAIAEYYDGMTWLENRGGQFAMLASNMAAYVGLESQSHAMLRITMTHRGQPGDTDEELSEMILLFEEAGGDPLTSVEADALIEDLHLYVDNGNGVFEPAYDTLFVTLSSFSLSNGMERIVLPDYDESLQVVHGTPHIYFLVANLAVEASAQSPDRFRITHLTEGGPGETSSAEDRDNDLQLALEYATNRPSRIIVAISRDTDTDADLIPDYWEQEYFGGPTNAAAGIDEDMDGESNYREFVADTDPWRSASFLEIIAISNMSGSAIYFMSSASRVYSLNWSDDLSAGIWTNITGQTNRAGTGGLDLLSDPDAVSTMRFYRIEVSVP
ncbi:MAG: VCBS repeat-containing protein [Lentisphaerales bacterium]|nr:MAG: VCBS repeat-containing protein [Lentisphaerales bacterium]